MGLFRTILRRSFYAAAISTLLLLATLIIWSVTQYRLGRATYGIGEDIAGVLRSPAIANLLIEGIIPKGAEGGTGASSYHCHR